jgi:acyl CoA:acetate/3-ketoacid CoA transferase beta subunit
MRSIRPSASFRRLSGSYPSRLDCEKTASATDLCGSHGDMETRYVKQCSLPFTSLRPVDLVVTELAVIAFPGGRATLVETAPSITVENVVANTEADLDVPGKVPQMNL